MRRSRFFLSLLFEHIWSYLLGAALVVCTIWMTLAVPHYLQEAIEALQSNAPDRQAVVLDRIVWITVFAALIIIVRTGSRLLFFVPGRKVEFDLKNRLLLHLTSLQRDFYAKNPTGAIISRINNDINGVRLMMGFGLMGFVNTLATVSLAPWRMYQISPIITLYVMLPIVAAGGGMQWVVRRLRHHQMQQMATLQRISDFTVESYNGLDVLKSVRSFGWAEGRFFGINSELRQVYVRMSNIRAFLMPILNHLVNALKVGLLFGGGVLVVSGEMSIGGFTAYLVYLSLLVPPLMSMTFMAFVLQRGYTALESLEQIFLTKPSLPPLNPTADKALRAGDLRQGLSINHLTFSHEGNQQSPVLQNIHLHAKPGEVIGLFGRAGSGKTTLLNLINGWLQPPAGTVLLDGHDVGGLERHTLRNTVATVTQDAFLFSDSIFENVRYANPQAAEQEIGLALKHTAMEEDLERLPQGMHTLVGEKGVTLSGGQKQRVALARALVRTSNVLILDDVLSAVDHGTERILVDKMRKLRDANRIVIIVSHRISALVEAERTYVLQDGRVTQQGTHTELIAQAGIYRDSWHMQQNNPHEQPSPTNPPLQPNEA